MHYYPSLSVCINSRLYRENIEIIIDYNVGQDYGPIANMGMKLMPLSE